MYVYVFLSSLQLTRGHNRTFYTSEMNFSNIITNCVDFGFLLIFDDFKFAAICNIISKHKLPEQF